MIQRSYGVTGVVQTPAYMGHTWFLGSSGVSQVAARFKSFNIEEFKIGDRRRCSVCTCLLISAWTPRVVNELQKHRDPELCIPLQIGNF